MRMEIRVGIPISHMDENPFFIESSIVAIVDAAPNQEAVTVKKINNLFRFLLAKKKDSKSLDFIFRINPMKINIKK